MAKAKVTHSEDAVCVQFDGDKRRPEPATGAINFPGGHVEVSRASDGTYWAHIEVLDRSNVIESRIDYDRESWLGHGIPPIPAADRIEHIAIRIAAKVYEDGEGDTVHAKPSAQGSLLEAA